MYTGILPSPEDWIFLSSLEPSHWDWLSSKQHSVLQRINSEHRPQIVFAHLVGPVFVFDLNINCSHRHNGRESAKFYLYAKDEIWSLLWIMNGLKSQDLA